MDGRVPIGERLATIETLLDQLSQSTDEIKVTVGEIAETQNGMAIALAVNAEKWEQHEKDHAELKAHPPVNGKDEWARRAAVAGAFFGSLISIITGRLLDG